MCKEKLKKYPFLVCYITLHITTYNNIAIIVKSEQKKIHTYIRTSKESANVTSKMRSNPNKILHPQKMLLRSNFAPHLSRFFSNKIC